MTDPTHRLDQLHPLGIAPGQVTARLEELRPGLLAGDAAAMVAAINQVRGWWDIYDRELKTERELPPPRHITAAFGVLMQLITQAAEEFFPGLLDDARAAARQVAADDSGSPWLSPFWRSLHAGLVALPDHAPASEAEAAQPL